MTTPFPYRTDPFFENLFPAEDKSERELAAMIRADRLVTDPVVVWAEQGILIDGYRRTRIHATLTAEGIQLPPIPVFTKSFDSRDDAEQYVCTRCRTMRQMSEAQRATLWTQRHADELAALDAEARQNQANGSASARAPKAPEGGKTAPKAKGVDKRKEAAKRAGVSEHVLGAVLKLNERLAGELTAPERTNLLDVQKLFLDKKIAYRTVLNEIEKMDDSRAEEARKAAASDAPLAVLPDTDDETPPVDRILVCDRLAGLARLADESVTLFLTSPPYPLKDYTYAGHNLYGGDYPTYLADLKATFAACYAKQRKGGRIIVQIDANKVSHGPTGGRVTLPIYADVVNKMREVGYEFLDEICWFKQHSSGKKGRVRWGTYCSATAPSIRRTHEYLLVFFKETPALPGDDGRLIPADAFRRLTISQWYIPPETKKFRSADGMRHPCPFPETLAYNAITLYSRKGDLVVDPYSGTGTVPYVAHCLNRRYVGIDLMPEFGQIAETRIAEVKDLTPDQRRKGLRLFTPNDTERSDGWGQRKGGATSRIGRRRKFPRKPNDEPAK